MFRELYMKLASCSGGERYHICLIEVYAFLFEVNWKYKTFYIQRPFPFFIFETEFTDMDITVQGFNRKIQSNIICPVHAE